jgi:hypothetical protein
MILGVNYFGILKDNELIFEYWEATIIVFIILGVILLTSSIILRIKSKIDSSLFTKTLSLSIIGIIIPFVIIFAILSGLH